MGDMSDASIMYNNVVGMFSSYSNNAVVAAKKANKHIEGVQMFPQAIPITSLEEAKKIASKKVGLLYPGAVIGAVKLTGQHRLDIAKTYCDELATREGHYQTWSNRAIEYSKDFKYAACIEPSEYNHNHFQPRYDDK